MGRPIGSKNKSAYPSHRHRNFYWSIVSKKYLAHLAAFKRMHDRVRCGKVSSIEWERDLDGLVAFIKASGPIPIRLRKPSIGRINHAVGYISGNIVWEEHGINSVKRKGTRYESLAYQLHT